jgi:HPt (histidine-containing phosphotransfer) domain-containing protein
LKFLTPSDWEAGSQSKNKRFNDELYDKLKVFFVTDNKEIYGLITGAINAGDIKLAHRLVHTLKSSAGILGKEVLQQTADGIEQKLLKEGNNPVSPEELNKLEEEINKVLVELAPYEQMSELSKTGSNTGIEAIAAYNAKEFIDELMPLLENGDPACLKFLDGLRIIQDSEEIIQMMENMDFAPAARALRKLLVAP